MEYSNEEVLFTKLCLACLAGLDSGGTSETTSRILSMMVNSVNYTPHNHHWMQAATWIQYNTPSAIHWGVMCNTPYTSVHIRYTPTPTPRHRHTHTLPHNTHPPTHPPTHTHTLSQHTTASDASLPACFPPLELSTCLRRVTTTSTVPWSVLTGDGGGEGLEEITHNITSTGSSCCREGT